MLSGGRCLGAGLAGIALAIAGVLAGPAAAGAPSVERQTPAQTLMSDIPAPAPAGSTAGEYYKNLHALQQIPAERLIPAMLQNRTSLGVDCTYCHTPGNWPSDGVPNKLKARTHFQMVAYLRDEHFDKKPMVTCWTCHRGHAVPESLPEDGEMTQRVATMMNLAARDTDKPAEKVFMNIQTLKGVPAGRFPQIMTMFSRSLGVRCNFCHLPDNFASDDKDNKKMARKMLGMVRGTLGKFYNGDGPVACFTCHHGAETPEISAGKAAD